jgi:hypothetical protein
VTKHDFIGQGDFVLSKLVSSKDQELICNLTGNPKSEKAKVKIMATEKK